MSQSEEKAQFGDDCPKTPPKNDAATYPYKSVSEYTAAVNRWLWQCYHWQCFALTYPYYAGLAASSSINTAVTSSGTPDLNRNFANTYVPSQGVFAPARAAFGPSGRQGSEAAQGSDYVIPPLWKRFAAEVIDFFILLVLKVMITYIAVDFFDLINLDKYDFDMLKNEKMDYHKAMEVTSEIITLEVIHRFVVCLFEALCLHKGIVGIGGATPGKSAMKLKVISCHTAIQLNHNRVRVIPAGDLGFGWALLRAFIKNFSLAFIFPICFTMFFFQHNRTAYDIICNSIVVEDHTQYQRRN